MADECKDCKKSQEEMYWTRFQSVQFCQILSGNFRQQLAIPQKFVNNVRDKLGGPVTLRGPSGSVWNVELASIESTLFFKEGWTEFVDAHSLGKTDILIFRYNGHGQYEVSIFDIRSLCEKEASYFVRNCSHSEFENDCEMMGDLPAESDESSHDVVDCSPAKRPSKIPNRTASSGEVESDCEMMADLPAESDEESDESSHDVDYSPAKRPRKMANRTASSKGTRSSRNKTSASRFHLESNRKPVTEEEKKKALQKADAALSERSFIVVMRASQVYRGFQMTIPLDWARAHLMQKHQDIILRVREKTWPVRFYYRDRRGGMFTAGWKNFVLENILEEFDVCLFSLASKLLGPVVMDVSIFRVVEDVVPPSRLP